MTIVDIIVIAGPSFKIFRGSDIESVIAFTKGLFGCDEFKRDNFIVRKSQIG